MTTAEVMKECIMNNRELKRIAILGLGLIGGSIARRLVVQKSKSNNIEVHVWNHNSRPYKEAQECSMITYKSIDDIDFTKIDIVIICTPIEVIDEILFKLSQNDQIVNNLDLIICDIASVKAPIAQLAYKYGFDHQFVGLHPMFGTEKTGFENSSSELGNNANWVVCPLSKNPQNDIARHKASLVAKFIREHLHGKTIFANEDEHDKAVALSSHIPHVLAYELAALISQDDMKLAKTLSASSFRDYSRVARGNTQLFKDMLELNNTNIAPILFEVSKNLHSLAVSLESDLLYRKKKDIHHFIAKSDSFRSSDDEKSIPVHKHTGDGWVECRCGRTHWGKAGAAGLMLMRFDSNGKVSEIVLQHRALWSAEGGTWGTPGGAIDLGETPTEGALREAKEEANINKDQIVVLDSITRDHKDWSFTTVLAMEKHNETVIPQLVDQESLDVKWVKVDEIPNIELLSAFKREFSELITCAQTAYQNHNLLKM